MEQMTALGHGEAHNAELFEGISSPSASLIDSLYRQQEIESAFCRDFRCCGQQLPDLHDLLHHYEEHHACNEDNNDSDSFDTASLDNNDLLLLNICSGDAETVNPVNTTLTTSPGSQRSGADEEDTILGSPLSNSDSSSGCNSDDEQLAKTPSPVNEPLWPLPAYHVSYKDPDWLVQVNQALLSNAYVNEDIVERPYRCEVHGCDKAYKNVNGLKYHKAHGHCNENQEDELERNAKKPYHCAIGFCRKRYKNLNGLKYHIEHTHMAKLRRQQK